MLKLSPSLKLVDYFAPTSWFHDNADDFDLSTAPALLPNGLVFVAGKSFSVYTLDESHLGHVGGQLQTTADFCGNDPDGGIADLNGLLFVPCRDGLRAVRPTAPAPPTAIWHTSTGADSSPIVAGGLVWSIANGVSGNLGNLYALNPNTGAVVQTVQLMLLGARTSRRLRLPTGSSGPSWRLTCTPSWGRVASPVRLRPAAQRPGY